MQETVVYVSYKIDRWNIIHLVFKMRKTKTQNGKHSYSVVKKFMTLKPVLFFYYMLQIPTVLEVSMVYHKWYSVLYAQRGWDLKNP